MLPLGAWLAVCPTQTQTLTLTLTLTLNAWLAVCHSNWTPTLATALALATALTPDTPLFP